MPETTRRRTLATYTIDEAITELTRHHEINSFIMEHAAKVLRTAPEKGAKGALRQVIDDIGPKLLAHRMYLDRKDPWRDAMNELLDDLILNPNLKPNTVKLLRELAAQPA